MNRTLALVLGLLALGGAAVGLTVVATTGQRAEAALPHHFETFRRDLQTFQTVYAIIDIGRLDNSDVGYMVLQARDDGRVVFDINRAGVRMSWDGQQLVGHLRGHDLKPYGLAFDLLATHAWEEVRSGFANSTWVEDAPTAYGLGRREYFVDWMRIDLPESWAPNISVYVALTNTRGKISQLVLVDRAAGEILDYQTRWAVTVPYIAWDVPLGPDFDSPEHFQQPYPKENGPFGSTWYPYHERMEHSQVGTGPDDVHGEGHGPGHTHGYGFEAGHTHGWSEASPQGGGQGYGRDGAPGNQGG